MQVGETEVTCVSVQTVVHSVVHSEDVLIHLHGHRIPFKVVLGLVELVLSDESVEDIVDLEAWLVQADVMVLAVVFVVHRDEVELSLSEGLLLIVNSHVSLNALMVHHPDGLVVDPAEPIGNGLLVFMLGVQQVLWDVQEMLLLLGLPDDELVLQQIVVQIESEVRGEYERVLAVVHDVGWEVMESVDLLPCDLVQVLVFLRSSLIQELSVTGQGLVHIVEVLAEDQLVLLADVAIFIQVLGMDE
jgi:hypothetical protein